MSRRPPALRCFGGKALFGDGLPPAGRCIAAAGGRSAARVTCSDAAAWLDGPIIVVRAAQCLLLMGAATHVLSA